MQLTKHTDLSLRVMIFLAIHRDRLATVKEIAEIYNVSRNHLVKVVHKLASIGYLTSVKGRNGGITLAVQPEDIIVGDIVRAMESGMSIECGDCPLVTACLLKGAVHEAMAAFLKSLDQYSISNLIRNKPQISKFISII